MNSPEAPPSEAPAKSPWPGRHEPLSRLQIAAVVGACAYLILIGGLLGTVVDSYGARRVIDAFVRLMTDHLFFN
jgi:hypothetical protein